MKTQKHPWDIRKCNKGANIDVDAELHGGLEDGHVIDRNNMRTKSMDGYNESSKKIGGEEILYPNIDNRCNGGSGLPLSTTYACMATVEINEHIVEIWADSDFMDPSLIRVDGLIVLMSDDFPITYDHPVQIAKNEACIGGEFYITDFNVQPMFFNVKDLLLNSNVNVGDETGSCTEKYFTDFNLDEHVLALKSTLEHLVFLKLDASATGYDYVFGANGLPVGYVSYSHRYVTSDGERTAWSAPTPQIPIVKTVSAGCTNHPYVKTISKDPDISNPSVYGAHVRLRINNENNFDFIEIRRDSWVAGDPLGTPATSEVAGQIDIDNGQFGVIDILDRGGSEEILSGEDTTSVMSVISRAKAIRYFNQRLYLMNVEYQSRDVDSETNLIDEGLSTVAFPAIEKIFKAGHSDPYLATYYKSTMRGEKHGYGILVWDDQGEFTYVKPIGGAENLQMPNRREETSSLTEGVSYFGTVKAANVDGSVSQTHEVFDLVDAVEKTDACLFANILEAGSKSEASTNEVTGVPWNCDPTDASWVTAGQVQADQVGYKPFTPVSQDDSDCRYHDYLYNIQVGKTDADLTQYLPDGFEPNYFSAGFAFKGVQDLPSWAKAFSIVRTEPAYKVVAQGLGYYSLKSATTGAGLNTEKFVDEMAVYFPDLDENTGIDPGLIEDVKNNPTAYSVQLVSPLGFFTEVATYLDRSAVISGGRDKGVDMITYCRILQDNGQINPGENPSMGIDDGGGNRYVAYGKWRGDAFPVGTIFPAGAQGNQEIDIDAVVDYNSHSGRMNYFRLQLDQNPYIHGNTAGDDATDEPGVKNFHEPLYVVNIVRKVADIPTVNTQSYISTGHYQKLSSVVGVSDGSNVQTYPLVDERWEDVRQSTDGEVQNDYSALERFVYIKDAAGDEKRWLNIDNISGAPLTAILVDLNTNGFHDITDASGTYRVYGVYTTSQTTEGTAPVYWIDFEYTFAGYDQGIFIPESGDEIIVKYDNRIPIKVFGGDTWINESTWAVKDKEYQDDGEPVDQGTYDFGDGQGEFRLNVAWPFKRFKMNPRVFVVRDGSAAVNKIQGADIYNVNPTSILPSSLRQLIAMWTAETKINLSFAFNDELVKHSSDQYFALKNYVMRPHMWDNGSFDVSAGDVYSDNNIFAAYETDYGDEFLLWQYGGFRFKPQTNLDYSKTDNTRLFSSVPSVGFTEENHYCTRIAWSAKRPINIQNSPGIRTFLTQNVYDISDDTGEIKFGWSAISEKGNNLYAFTDSGVCLLLIDKRIIHEINANELATVGSDIGGILNELWLNREIGMSGEMWRSAAEHSNMIMWVNQNSAYFLAGNMVKDIGRDGYYSKLRDILDKFYDAGFNEYLAGVYDIVHNEYWCLMQSDKAPAIFDHPTIVYNQAAQQWEGTFDYIFDKFLSFNNATYGMRNLETYELNKGRIINGELIEAYLIQASAVSSIMTRQSSVKISDKEFVRIRINSDNKPVKVDFFNNLDQLLANNIQCSLDTTVNPLALKDYHGFEQYIPRKTANRNRVQGRLLIFKIIHNLDEDWRVASTGIQYKQLK